MPKLKSAKKRLRQSERRALVNAKKKEAYKDIKRKVKKALTQGKKGEESFSELSKQFYKAVDKAAKGGIIHANKAAREKSRMMAAIGVSNAPEIKEKPTKKKTTRTARKSAKATPKKAGRKKASARKAK